VSEAKSPTIPPRAAPTVDTFTRTLPKLLQSVEPEYPPSLAAARIRGSVEVRFVIGRDGRVSNVRATSGPPPLRGVAEAAVMRRRYEPATYNGVPTEATGTVIFSFNP
jgi:protein TonB